MSLIRPRAAGVRLEGRLLRAVFQYTNDDGSRKNYIVGVRTAVTPERLRQEGIGHHKPPSDISPPGQKAPPTDKSSYQICRGRTTPSPLENSII